MAIDNSTTVALISRCPFIIRELGIKKGLIRPDLECNMYDPGGATLENNHPLIIRVDQCEGEVNVKIKSRDYLDYLLLYVEQATFNCLGDPFPDVKHIMFKGCFYTLDGVPQFLEAIDLCTDAVFEIKIVFTSSRAVIELDGAIVFFHFK